MNDPNGLIYFNGMYYVFFQWNRFELNHSYKEWGLFTSRNMISWNFIGSALLPDQDYDCHGVYSGSGYEMNNELCLFYTGNTKYEGKRKSYQCLAVSKDGRRYIKKGPILTTPKEYTEHFRDPKVFRRKDGSYSMLVGAQLLNGCGAIALCHSLDGVKWSYVGKIASSNLYQMIECPDLFSIDETDVLIFCPQKRDNEHDTSIFSFAAYKIGHLSELDDLTNSEDLDTHFKLLDYGFDYYAPQTFEDENGRRLIIAWMSNMNGQQEEEFSKNERTLHCMTMPREVRVIDGILYQKPITEMYELLADELSMELKDETIVIYPTERAVYLNLEQLNVENCMNINFFHNEFIFNYDKYKKLIKISRKDWVTNEYTHRVYEQITLSEIEVWIDNSSIEMFINKGEISMSSRIYPLTNKLEISIDGINSLTKIKANKVEALEMNGGL